MAKLKTRTNQPVTDSEGLLDHIAQDGRTTQIGDNLYVDGDVETGGSVNIADNLIVGTKANIPIIETERGKRFKIISDDFKITNKDGYDLFVLKQNEQLTLINTKGGFTVDKNGSVQLIGSNLSLSANGYITLSSDNAYISLSGTATTLTVGDDILFDKVPLFEFGLNGTHTFDIKSAFAFRKVTAEEKTQYGLDSSKTYFISPNYNIKNVVDRILSERLHLLKFVDTETGLYPHSVYTISSVNGDASGNNSIILSLYSSPSPETHNMLIMYNRTDGVAIFEMTDY